MYAYGRRYRSKDEELQHVLLVFPLIVGVKPGLLAEGTHMSDDGVQVDMFFVDLGNARESIGDMLEWIEGL
jgi:hypothetical protein